MKQRKLIYFVVLLLLLVIAPTVFALPNPAAVFCSDQGYKNETRTDQDGNQYGVCIFDDGKSCGDWAFFRGECGTEYRKDEDSSQATASSSQTDRPVDDQDQNQQASPEAEIIAYQNKINQLKEQYKQQLQDYRVIEKEFKISKDQYLELQTLASIEKAVQSSKQVLSARNKVLLTYLDILKHSLLLQHGIPESEKNYVLVRIEAIKSELEVFDKVVDSSTDRDKINLVFRDFIEFGDSIEQISDHATLLIDVAKLQTVYDNSSVFFVSIVKEHNEDDEGISQNEVKRAISETDKILEQEKVKLASIWQEIIEQKDKNSNYKSLSTKLKPELNSIYSNLNKLLSYLEELVELETK